MNEIAPILDKLVNAGIVFGAIVVGIFLVAFTVVVTLIIKSFNDARKDPYGLGDTRRRRR